MDNFALLGLPRQPAPNLEIVKTKFLEISAVTHPDRFHHAGTTEQTAATQRYATLNAAYTCLREPRSRLLHLLELESGAPPVSVQSIPEGAMKLFADTGQLCRETDQFLARRAKTVSPLAQAQLFGEGLQQMEKLNALRALIGLREEEFLAELKLMNTVWNDAPPPGSAERAAELPLRRLEEVYRLLSYLARWNSQVQERVAQLAI
jgi:curved DNA-binding protein CbpA